jgi:hypothetical protein
MWPSPLKPVGHWFIDGRYWKSHCTRKNVPGAMPAETADFGRK